jgi:hypothetical protein
MKQYPVIFQSSCAIWLAIFFPDLSSPNVAVALSPVIATKVSSSKASFCVPQEEPRIPATPVWCSLEWTEPGGHALPLQSRL